LVLKSSGPLLTGLPLKYLYALSVRIKRLGFWVIGSVLAISKRAKMDSKLTGLERVRHLAQLGMWGDVDAIKKLHLDNFEITQLPEISEMESSTLR